MNKFKRNEIYIKDFYSLLFYLFFLWNVLFSSIFYIYWLILHEMNAFNVRTFRMRNNSFFFQINLKFSMTRYNLQVNE